MWKSKDKPKSDRFLYLIAALLLVILGGIWIPQRRTKNETAEAEGAPVSGATANAPATLAKPTRRFSAENLSDPELLIDLVKEDDGDAIRQVFAARRTKVNQSEADDDQFKAIMFERACEHNASKVIAVVGQSHGSLKSLSKERILSSFRKLIENKNYDGIRSVLNWRIQSTDLPYLNAFIREEFAKEPWNEELMSRFTAWENYQLASQLKDLLKIAVEGDSARWTWLMGKMKTVETSQAIAAFLMEVPATAENVDRLIEIMPYFPNRNDFLNDCYRKGLLNKSHFNSIGKLYQRVSLPKEILNLLYEQDLEVVKEWMEVNRHVREQVQLAWFEGKELSRFEPCIEVIRPFTKNERDWPVYSHGDINIDRWNWLWNHGFRPREDASPITILTLAILQKDIELCRQSFTQSSPEFSYFLENGLQVTGNAKPLPNEQQLNRESNFVQNEDGKFIPLLVAIRTWDLDAVKTILASHPFDWRRWHFTNPVVAALLANKKEMAAHLLTVGVPLDAVSLQKLKQYPDVNLTGLLPETVVETPKDLNSVDNLTIAAQNAARAGDLNKLGKVLESASFRSDIQQNENRSYLQMLELHDDEYFRKKWQSILLASVDQPRCLERLQLEGFPIETKVLKEIMRVGNQQSLAIAMRDIQTRMEILQNEGEILAAAKSEEMAIAFLKIYRGENVSKGSTGHSTDPDRSVHPKIELGFEPNVVKSSGDGRFVLAWGPRENRNRDPEFEGVDDLALIDLKSMQLIASTTVAKGIFSADLDSKYVYVSPRKVPGGSILRMDHKLSDIRTFPTDPDRAYIALISPDRLAKLSSPLEIIDTDTFEKVALPKYIELGEIIQQGHDCVAMNYRFLDRSTWKPLRYKDFPRFTTFPNTGNFQLKHEAPHRVQPNFWGRVQNSSVQALPTLMGTILPIRQWPIVARFNAPHEKHARVTLEIISLRDAKPMFSTILDTNYGETVPPSLYRICLAEDKIVVANKRTLFVIAVPEAAKNTKPPCVFDFSQQTEIKVGGATEFPLRTFGTRKGLKYSLSPQYPGVRFDEQTGTVRIGTKLMWNQLMAKHFQKLHEKPQSSAMREENANRYKEFTGQNLPEKTLVGELAFYAQMHDGAELLDFIQFTVLVIGPIEAFDNARREHEKEVERLRKAK